MEAIFKMLDMFPRSLLFSCRRWSRRRRWRKMTGMAVTMEGGKDGAVTKTVSSSSLSSQAAVSSQQSCHHLQHQMTLRLTLSHPAGCSCCAASNCASCGWPWHVRVTPAPSSVPFNFIPDIKPSCSSSDISRMIYLKAGFLPSPCLLMSLSLLIR